MLLILLMEEILHQLISVYIGWYGRYPIIYRVLYIPGGVGFLPSTVCKYISIHTHVFLPRTLPYIVSEWMDQDGWLVVQLGTAVWKNRLSGFSFSCMKSSRELRLVESTANSWEENGGLSGLEKPPRLDVKQDFWIPPRWNSAPARDVDQELWHGGLQSHQRRRRGQKQ